MAEGADTVLNLCQGEIGETECRIDTGTMLGENMPPDGLLHGRRLWDGRIQCLEILENCSDLVAGRVALLGSESEGKEHRGRHAGNLFIARGIALSCPRWFRSGSPRRRSLPAPFPR